MNDGSRDNKRWLDDPRNVDKIFWALVAVCASLVALDFFYDKHVHYGYESWLGFHGLFGFISSVSLVMTAKLLRKGIKRDEDYYE